MRPIHIVVLLLAGALGGAVIMKVARPGTGKPAVAVAHPVPAPPTATAPAPVAPAPEPISVIAAESSKPSPMPPPATHVVFVPRRIHPVAPVVAAIPLPVVQSPAPPPAPEPPLSSPAPAPPQPANPEPPQVPAAAVPRPHQVTLNAGLVLPVRLVDRLSSERNVPGDVFAATLDQELVVDGFVIAERGARVEGRVIAVDRARAGRPAALALELTMLRTSDGQSVAIQTESYFKHAGRPQIDNATKIAGGAILGAAIGALAGGGKGAAIGAGIGGSAGAGDVLLTRRPADLPSETVVSFRLKNPVPLTEQLH